MIAQALIARGNRVLMVKQRKHGRTYWNFPGGHVEAGETAESACLRETLEETGYRIDITGCLLRRSNKVVFLARITGGTPRLEEGLLDMDWRRFDDANTWDAKSRPIIAAYLEQQ